MRDIPIALQRKKLEEDLREELRSLGLRLTVLAQDSWVIESAQGEEGMEMVEVDAKGNLMPLFALASGAVTISVTGRALEKLRKEGRKKE